MNDFKGHLLVPLICTVLFFGGVGIYAKEMKKEKAAMPSPTPQLSSDVNGVYTNYKYGFKFEYPEEIFDTLNTEINDSTAYYMEKTSTNKEYPLFLDLYSYKYSSEDKTGPGFSATLYFAAIDKKNGEKISQYDYKNKTFVSVGTKISDLNNSGVKGVFYQYEEKFEDHRIGMNYYSADWLNGDNIFVVRIAARDKKILEKFRSKFEKMIESFEFIAPSN